MRRDAVRHVERRTTRTPAPSATSAGRVFSAAETREAIASGLVTRARMCDGKVRFPHGAAAEKARGDIEARYREPGSLRSYACPFCGGWHFARARRAVASTQ